MAKTIEPNEISFRSTRHPRLYPWSDWFNGSVWELEPGDYDGTAKAFRAYCFHIARGFDYRLRTKIKGDLLYIQALDSDGNEITPPL